MFSEQPQWAPNTKLCDHPIKDIKEPTFIGGHRDENIGKLDNLRNM